MKRATTAALVLPVWLIFFGTLACNRTEPQRAEQPPAAVPSAAPDQRSDTSLSTAVQAKYYADENLRGEQINVSAENGVVTLRGTVPTESAKQQAVSVARGVEGVTSVNDELQIRQTPETRADARAGESAPPAGTAGRDADTRQPWWITTKIQAGYFTDADVKPWNIDVTTSSTGVVTLEGRVDSVEAKNEAVRIARETEGVTRVDDRLRVEAEGRKTEEAGDVTAIGQPDAWLTAKVQAKYFVDDEVKGRNIDVDTQNGVVTLNGSVGSEAERRQAVAIARNTDGVRSVTDKLRIDASLAAADRDRPAGSGTADRDRPAAERDRAGTRPSTAVADMERPDPWITMKIQSKYFLDAEVKGHQIDVDTKEGVVTLKGRVDTAQQKQEAEQIARETEGVRQVNNQLTVGGAAGA